MREPIAQAIRSRSLRWAPDALASCAAVLDRFTAASSDGRPAARRPAASGSPASRFGRTQASCWPSSAVDRSLPAPADIERHQQMKIRIGVAREGQRREARFVDDDPQFLLQLPDQASAPAVRPPRPCRREIPTSRPSACPPGARRSARARRHRRGRKRRQNEFHAHDLRPTIDRMRTRWFGRARRYVHGGFIRAWSVESQ